MHAVTVNTRVEEFALDPEHRTLRERIVPEVAKLDGFRAGYWFAPVDGSATGVVIFESEDAARSGAEVMGVRPGVSLMPGVTVESVEYREVIGSA